MECTASEKHFAHAPGRVLSATIRDSAALGVIATAGADGEVLVHSCTPGSEWTLLGHRRAHRGRVCALVACGAGATGARLYTAADDGLVVETRVDGIAISSMDMDVSMSSRTVARFDACHARSLAVSAEGTIAASLSDGRIVLLSSAADVDTENELLAETPASALAVCFIAADVLAALSPTGEVHVFRITGASGDERASLSALPGLSLAVGMSEPVQLVLASSGFLLAVGSSSGVFVISLSAEGDAPVLRLVEHVRPPGASSFAAAVHKDLVFASHTAGLSCMRLNAGVVDLSDRDALFPNAIQGVTSLCVLSPTLIAASMADGHLSVLAVPLLFADSHTKLIPAGPTSAPASSATRAAHAERPVHTIQPVPITPDDARADEHDGFGSEYDVPSPRRTATHDLGNDSGKEGVSAWKHMVPLKETPPKAFQPGETPARGEYRLLAWTDTAAVVVRSDEGYASVEVDFADTLFHRPLRFVDELGLSCAAVGPAGALFARRRNDTGSIGALLHFAPLDDATAWVQPAPWSLSVDGDVAALAVGTHWSFVATASRTLHALSPHGVQGPPAALSGAVLSVSARGDHVAALSWSRGALSVSVFACDTRGVLARVAEAAVPVSEASSVTWIGFASADEGDVCDVPPLGVWEWSAQRMHVLSRGVWTPFDAHVDGAEHAWPVAFSRDVLTAVIVPAASAAPSFPDALPRPLLRSVPLRLPVLGVRSETTTAAAEHVLRAAVIFPPQGETPSALKARSACDKSTLALVGAAIADDRPLRALAACRAFLQQARAWGLAADLARAARMDAFATVLETECATWVPPSRRRPAPEHASVRTRAETRASPRSVRFSDTVAVREIETVRDHPAGLVGAAESFAASPESTLLLSGAAFAEKPAQKDAVETSGAQEEPAALPFGGLFSGGSLFDPAPSDGVADTKRDVASASLAEIFGDIPAKRVRT